MIDKINVCSMLPSDTAIPRSSCDTTYWNRYKMIILMMMLAIPNVMRLIGVARNCKIFLITQYINQKIAHRASNNGVADHDSGSIVSHPCGMYSATITSTSVLMIIERSSDPSIVRTCRDRYKYHLQNCLLRNLTYRNLLSRCKRKCLLLSRRRFLSCNNTDNDNENQCKSEYWLLVVLP